VGWVELFVAFVVAHMVGDYLLQTDWQARHKANGLGGDPVARRALVTHVCTYTLAFVPVFVWIGDDLSVGWAIAAAALVFVPHLIVDDGRLLRSYVRRVKGADPRANPGVLAAADQTVHAVCLWALAMLLGAM
jgi:hypothetical protein